MKNHLGILIDIKNTNLSIDSFILEKAEDSIVDSNRLSVIYNILINHIIPTEGEVWECGVYKGGSALLIANILAKYNYIGKLRLFDTFSGMPKISSYDTDQYEGKFSDVNYDNIKEKFKDFSFVELNRGLIPETFIDKENSIIAFAHLDLDIYESTKNSLSFIFPRLLEYGSMIIDDYGFTDCGGCKIAVDEFLADKRTASILTKFGSLIIIKIPSDYKRITYQDIPGWCDFENIYDEILAHSLSGDIFVEVGCFMGKSFAYLLERASVLNKKIHAYPVDTFEITPDDDTGGSMPWGENALNWQFNNGGKDALYDAFLSNILKVDGASFIDKVLRMRSVEAAKQFKNESIKFCFIDASHLYENVKDDLNAWYPKIRNDGALAGHDYMGEGVKKAVHEFASQKNLKIAVDNNTWILLK